MYKSMQIKKNTSHTLSHNRSKPESNISLYDVAPMVHAVQASTKGCGVRGLNLVKSRKMVQNKRK